MGNKSTKTSEKIANGIITKSLNFKEYVCYHIQYSHKIANTDVIDIDELLNNWHLLLNRHFCSFSNHTTVFKCVKDTECLSYQDFRVWFDTHCRLPSQIYYRDNKHPYGQEKEKQYEREYEKQYKKHYIDNKFNIYKEILFNIPQFYDSIATIITNYIYIYPPNGIFIWYCIDCNINQSNNPYYHYLIKSSDNIQYIDNKRVLFKLDYTRCPILCKNHDNDSNI